VAHGQIKFQRPLPEGVWKITIVGVVQMIVQLETDAEDRIGDLIAPNSDFKKRIAEFPAKPQCWFNLAGVVLVSAFVQILAQSPTALPRLFVSIPYSGEAEHPIPVN
jgi:hypothetical protein